MALSEAKKAADRRHNAKLDQIMIRPYKEEGAAIRAAAARSGKSLQGYILGAVRKQMEGEAAMALRLVLGPDEPNPAPRAPAAPRQEKSAGPVTPPAPVQDQPIRAEKAAEPLPPRPVRAARETLPIEKRVPIERLGTEVLKLESPRSGEEILRIERAMAGVEMMTVFCNMTKEERAEWKRRRGEALLQRRQRAASPE